MTENLDISSQQFEDNKSLLINDEKSSRRAYKQIYRKDWENNPIFKGWLSPVSCDKHKAECTACHKELLAHRLTLLKHASSAKHLQKVALLKNSNNIGQFNSTIKINDHSSDNIENNSSALSHLPVVNLRDISIASFPIHNENDEIENDSLDNNENKELADEINNLPQISTSGTTVTITENFENAVSNIEENVIDKNYTETTVNPDAIPDNITGIIIQTESYVDLSDSSEAINFKQGYIAKNTSPSNKTNAAILSCTSAFLTDKIVGSTSENVMDKIRTYPLQVSTRVTDYSRGISVSNLNITLYKLTSGKWLCVAESVTDEVGRCNLFPKSESFFSVGCYKLHYDVTTYYELQNIKSYFPFIEISFIIRSPNETHHIPVMISPNGYTAYRSLDF